MVALIRLCFRYYHCSQDYWGWKVAFGSKMGKGRFQETSKTEVLLLMSDQHCPVREHQQHARVG
jgi:hypothetical protein